MTTLRFVFYEPVAIEEKPCKWRHFAV